MGGEHEYMKRLILESKRANLGLSQEQVALALGISRPFYTQIENGTRDPSVKVALKIANYYGLSMDEIFLPAGVA